MSRSRSRVPRCCLALMLLLSALGSVASGAAPTDSPSPPLDLFQAMKDGVAEVAVIAQDSKRLTLQFKNLSDKPILLKLPKALAAAPVLAQFQPGPLAIDPGNQRNRAPQVLGVGMPPNGNVPNLFPGAVFNVPAGKVIRKKMACVCLQHGRPDPTPHFPYEIKPLREVTEKPEVERLLAGLARKAYSQRVAQIAAWHLCNDMKWDELARLTVRIANGQRFQQFSVAEVKQAKSVLAGLSTATKPAPSQVSQN